MALVSVLVFPALMGEPSAPPLVTGAPFATAPMGAATQPAGTPPPLTGTPRQQADQLFNRVMQEESSGNSDQARFFADMAIQAYGMAGATDADALFHIALLQLVAGDGAAAVTSGEQILTTMPNHLLGLAVAARGALAIGDSTAARAYSSRFLANFDAELATALPEYDAHATLMPQYKDEAEALLSGGI